MSCILDNGIREFPSTLTTILLDGYASTAPQATRYLNKKVIVKDDATISIKVLLEDTSSTTVFLEWWVDELEYGTKNFLIEVPYFGIIKKWKVLSLTNINQALRSGKFSTVNLKLKILDDIKTAISENTLSCN